MPAVSLRAMIAAAAILAALRPGALAGCCVGMFVLLAVPVPARAQEPAPPGPVEIFHPLPRVHLRVALEYKPGKRAGVCRDDTIFRQEIGARKGYDPFDPKTRGVPSGRVRVQVDGSPGGFTASYEYVDAHGKLVDKATLSAPRYPDLNCRWVMQYVAAVLAGDFLLLELQLAEELEPRPPPSRPACSPSNALPAAEPLSCPESPYSVWPREPPMLGGEPDPPKPPARWPVAVRLGVAVWPELIATGWGSFGFSAEAGVRYRAFSAGIEAHGDPPLGSVASQSGGAVSFARVSGALLLCAHYGWFAGCGVGDVGRFIFPERGHRLPASTFYGAAGVRAGLEFPVLPPRLFVRAAVDLRAPIRPVSYTTHGASVFESAGPSLGLGLGLVAEFPP
jgi:hypothetical protein